MNLDISLAPEILFNIGSFPVTNSFFWSIILSAILIGIILYIRFSMKLVPGKLQSILEILLEEGINFIESIVSSKAKAKKLFPLVFTMFIFILFSNLVTFIPGQAAFLIDTPQGQATPFRAVMSDYGMVLVMTLVAVLTTQIVSVYILGPFGYIGKFINFKSPLKFFLGVMDIIGEIAKVVSLSFRLFGNIFAGEVLGGVMLFLVPFVVPLPFMFLGLLTAFVQAFVFSVLTLIFISMASEKESTEAELAT